MSTPGVTGSVKDEDGDVHVDEFKVTVSDEAAADSEKSSSIAKDPNEEVEAKTPVDSNSEDDESYDQTDSDREDTGSIFFEKPNMVPSTTLRQPIDGQFRKAIGLVLQIKGYDYTEQFLDEICNLSITRLDDLVSGIKKFTESQRRSKPSISDTHLCLRSKKITPSELYVEHLDTTQRLTPQVNSMISDLNSQTTKVIKEWTRTELEFFEGDSSLPFFMNEHYEITELVPKQKARPNYIPAFLPDLPPDYTYQKTAKYTNTISDLKELRLKLVEESKLAEKSLYNLIEDNESGWKKALESKSEQIDSDSESSDHDNSIMSDSHHDGVEISREADTPAYDVDTVDKSKNPAHEKENNEATNIPQPKANLPPNEDQSEGAWSKTKPNAFDIVAYAQSRKLIFEKREQNKERKRQLRASNIFIKAERYFSPYAVERATPEVNSFFQNSIEDELSSTIQSLRKADVRKKRKIEAFLAKKVKLDEQKEATKDQFEFSFNFDNIENTIDEDSDEDSDLNPPNNIEFAAPEFTAPEFTAPEFSEDSTHTNGENGVHEPNDGGLQQPESMSLSKSVSAISNDDMDSLMSDTNINDVEISHNDFNEAPNMSQDSPSSAVDIDEGDFEDI